MSQACQNTQILANQIFHFDDIQAKSQNGGMLWNVMLLSHDVVVCGLP